jgi:hypothetical protein
MNIKWDEEKNKFLKRERGISFEEVVIRIEEGALLDDIKHPICTKYPNQKIFIVELENYVYLIPYVKDKDNNEIFLKTIFPSKKLTKKYLGDKKNET